MTTTFTESDHPRATTGEFTTKAQSAPETALTAGPEGPEGQEAATLTDAQIDALDWEQLIRIRNRVLDRMGAMGMSVDREEARYRVLEEPEFYGYDLDKVAAVRERFGSDEVIGDIITRTNAWHTLGEVTDGESARITAALADALDEIQNVPVPGKPLTAESMPHNQTLSGSDAIYAAVADGIANDGLQVTPEQLERAYLGHSADPDRISTRFGFGRDHDELVAGTKSQMRRHLAEAGATWVTN
ncbi:hypothetical protein [Frigoribacterium sp. SL97]|uniref:hypothetical protein n=1 Tax=Frigoribacterium sp. SL97 TaxID=2994664 RepID=UPI0022712EF1|nr:hypothetical protein [Frigoribacterium sp. SL97]WAC50415.1 hypothetical protein OVA02_11090 [Frigoribacterium sp. SL97]